MTTPMIFPLSGASEDSVRAYADRLADWLAGPGAAVDLADIGYTLARRRSHLTRRSAVVAADRAELLTGLRALTSNAADPAVHSGVVDKSATGDPVFVFSGHGSQWAGMGAWLLDAEPSFAAVVADLEPVLAAEGRGSLRELLVDDYLDEAGFAEVQPAIFAVQVGLAAVLRDHGVRPAAVIGQSMGEVAAAAVAGALPLADAARVICRRSELMQTRLAGRGATALLELSPQDVERRITTRTGIDIAGYTSTRSTVIAGSKSDVDAMVSACESEGIAAHVVPGVGMAIHCRLVDDLLPDLVDALDRIEPSVPHIPFHSTAVESEQLLDAKYWAANLRNPVRLVDAVAAARKNGLRTFLEVSPHPVLVRSLLDTLGNEATVVATLRRDQPEARTLPGAVAVLHCAGAGIDWSRLYPSGRLVDLPTTVWRHQALWPPEKPAPRAEIPGHPLLGAHIRIPGVPRQHVWQSTLNVSDQPWLADHRLAGSPVLPGSTYCEMALAASTQAFGVPPERIALSDVDYRRLLPLNEPVTVTTTLTEDADGAARVEIMTGSGATRTVHATATVALCPVTACDDIAMPSCVPLTRYDDQEPAAVYERLRANEIQHGPAFAGLNTLVTSRDTAYYQVRHPETLPDDPRFRIHPAVLDACLHGVVGLLPPDTAGFLPAGVGRFRLLRDNPQGPLCCHARLATADRRFQAHVDVFDSTGAPVAQLGNVTLRAVDELPRLDHLLYTVDWQPSESTPTTRPLSGEVRQLGSGNASFAAALRDELAHTGAPSAVVLVDVAATDGAAQDRVTAAIETIKDLARTAGESPVPRLFLVTRQAWQVEPDERPDLARCGLDGLMRTVRDEHPRLRPTHIDIDADTTPAAVAAELAAESRDTEIALRAGRRYAAALRPVAADLLPHADVPLVRAGAAYVITGGTGGLGLLTARLLAERGAGLLILNSRSAPDDDALRQITDCGAEVVLVAGDIAEPGVAERLVRTAEEHDVALRGVVHAAGVLDDALLTDLNAERVHRVWSAKATGAWRLHLATAGHDLDWWVAYSSLAAVLGSAGQANYAAANAHVDAIVRWRRANKLPAITVNWGPVAEVGKVRDARFTGMEPLRPAQALAALEELITRDHPQTVVAHLRPGELLGALPHTEESSFFDPIRPTEPRQRADTVADQVRLRVCQVLGFARENLPADTPLVHLGLDSLTATRIKNALLEDFGVDLPVARLLQGASLLELTSALTDQIAPGPAAEHRSAQAERAAERARLRTRLAAKRRRTTE